MQDDQSNQFRLPSQQYNKASCTELINKCHSLGFGVGATSCLVWNVFIIALLNAMWHFFWIGDVSTF